MRGGDDDPNNLDAEPETAGMTIEMVDCLGTEYKLNTENNYTQWTECSLKTALDGEIFQSLPEDLQVVIKGVQKKTNNGAGNATVSPSEDNKLFLPAIAELYSEAGIKSTSDSGSDLSNTYHQDIYIEEGKQYKYYAELIGDQEPKSNCELLKKTVYGVADGDVEKGYWVRSPNSNSNQYVWRFGLRGDEYGYCMYNDDHPNVERGVSFMFCV